MRDRDGKEEPDYIKAHEFIENNRENVKYSSKCGCYTCLSIFESGDIEEWVGRDMHGGSGNISQPELAGCQFKKQRRDEG